MKLGAMAVGCPRCGRALPPIPINLRMGESTATDVEIKVEPEISELTYKAIRLAHPWCFGGKDDLPIEIAA